MPVGLGFCDASTFNDGCTIEIIFGVLPTVVLLLCARKALIDIAPETLDLNIPPYTMVHLVKLCLTLALPVLYIVGVICYIIMAYQQEEEIFFIYILVALIQTINWIITAYILRMEYKKFCFTSSYLKIYFSITFVVLLITDMLSYAFVLHFYGNIRLIDVVEVFKLVVLGLLTMYSWLMRKDSKNIIDPDMLIDRYHKVVDSDSVGGDERASFPPDQRASLRGSVTNSTEILNRFMNFQNRSTSNQTTGSGKVNISMQPELFENKDSFLQPKESYSITEIKISKWIEIMKVGKKTMSYVIQFKLNGKKCETKRSYSEFYKIFNKIRSLYPNYNFPKFPEKKSKNEAQQQEVLQERKDIFESFLKLLIERYQYENVYMKDFLRPETEIEDFTEDRDFEDIPNSYKDNQMDQPSGASYRSDIVDT
jgi:hypothetical protein